MSSITLQNYPPIILASQSPRRKALLSMLGVPFTSVSLDFDESYDLDQIGISDVPEYIARKKATEAAHLLTDTNIIITSDTLVVLNETILGKPTDKDHAIRMLQDLSGQSSQVITGVCLSSSTQKVSFSSTTLIEFGPMEFDEIRFYVDQYNPIDKAGAYGIQEWIGAAFIRKINGCYNNVVGLPTEQLYRQLKSMIGKERS